MIFSIKYTFAGRISAYIISVVLVIFCVIMILFYNIARDRIISSSMRYANEVMNNMSLKIESQLQSVVHTVENTAWVIDMNVYNSDSVESVLRHNLINNPLIIGSAVAFEPRMFGSEEFLDMVYATRVGQTVVTNDVARRDYYYPGMDWYLIPKLLKRGYWSEPYFDDGVGNMIMTTYSLPLMDDNGEVYAIYTADVSLLELSNEVEKIQPFRDSYSFMLSKNGYYISHHLKERILYETVFTNALESNNLDYDKIGREMLKAQSGSIRFENEGIMSYAIYSPIPNIGWFLCNVCKEDVLLNDLDTATRSIIILFTIGILCLFLFSILIIKKLIKPLAGFATSAQQIAHGNFDAHLPDIKSKDEMSTLHDSFAYMQRSLASYITELRETTASKERIESELNIAHEIQMGMIPKIFPPFPERADVDLYAILKPAREVGGDLYDFFISEDKLYFAIGDVSGKGIPASLFMAVTRSLFRNISGYIDSPEQIITRMNDSISEQNESSMFVTLFVGILDLQSGLMTYCNAGHNPPVMVKSNGEAYFMHVEKNLPVGIFKEFVYKNEEIHLDLDSKLFCYTDGVVEAENIAKEIYTDEKLIESISEHHSYCVKGMTEHILESVSLHAHSVEQSDDITILVINYKK